MREPVDWAHFTVLPSDHGSAFAHPGQSRGGRTMGGLYRAIGLKDL